MDTKPAKRARLECDLTNVFEQFRYVKPVRKSGVQGAAGGADEDGAKARARYIDTTPPVSRPST